jgi:hypothetical protein
MLDGVEISREEKVKAENLHGYDLQDLEIIFKSLLPEEKFVDRRIFTIEEVPPESDSDDEPAQAPSHFSQDGAPSSNTSINAIAKQYVGELISRVDFNRESPRFIQQ